MGNPEEGAYYPRKQMLAFMAIGLRSVEKTLKKYQGDHDLDYDPIKKIFTATIMIPIKKVPLTAT